MEFVLAIFILDFFLVAVHNDIAKEILNEGDDS